MRSISRARSAARSPCGSSSARDPDAAANDVRDRVGRVRAPASRRDRRADHREGRGRRAADHLDRPSRSDRHSRSRSPTTPTASSRTGLQSLPGVADARIFGERRYAMRIWLDRGAARRLQPHAAGRRERAAQRRTSRCRPAASRAATREFTVLSRDRPATPEQFARSSSARRRAIRCACATSARVELGPVDERVIVALQRAQPRSRSASSSSRSANPLDVAEGRARRAARRSPRCLPEGMKLEVALRLARSSSRRRSTGVPHDRRGDRCWSCS